MILTVQKIDRDAVTHKKVIPKTTFKCYLTNRQTCWNKKNNVKFRTNLREMNEKLSSNSYSLLHLLWILFFYFSLAVNDPFEVDLKIDFCFFSKCFYAFFKECESPRNRKESWRLGYLVWNQLMQQLGGFSHKFFKSEILNVQ